MVGQLSIFKLAVGLKHEQRIVREQGSNVIYFSQSVKIFSVDLFSLTSVIFLEERLK